MQALAFGFKKGKSAKKEVKNNSSEKENKPVKKATKKAKNGSPVVNGNDSNHDEDWRKRDEEVGFNSNL